MITADAAMRRGNPKEAAPEIPRASDVTKRGRRQYLP
jgi:hypothetical protein